MVSWMVSVVSMASRKTRLAFWTVSRVSVLRVRFGILQAWHGWLDPVKVPEFQIDPLPKIATVQFLGNRLGGSCATDGTFRRRLTFHEKSTEDALGSTRRRGGTLEI